MVKNIVYMLKSVKVSCEVLHFFINDIFNLNSMQATLYHPLRSISSIPSPPQ